MISLSLVNRVRRSAAANAGARAGAAEGGSDRSLLHEQERLLLPSEQHVSPQLGKIRNFVALVHNLAKQTMMRIKEAIQRRRLIYEMNEEVNADTELISSPCSPPSVPFDECKNEEQPEVNVASENSFHSFVQYLADKMSDGQKRALKVTWKRLSEAPKTSGRGTIHIMVKALTKLCEREPLIPAIFYRSAFLSCVEDRRCRRTRGRSIATIRDHAHILVGYIDTIFRTMFDSGCSSEITLPDPESVGIAHVGLAPLGFERRMWHVFGECFAEVMFDQECIRAFPHAPSAWSLLSIAMTDKMYAAAKPTSIALIRQPQPQQSWTTSVAQASLANREKVLRNSLSYSLVENREKNSHAARENFVRQYSFQTRSCSDQTCEDDMVSSVRGAKGASISSKAPYQDFSYTEKERRSISDGHLERCSPQTSFF